MLLLIIAAFGAGIYVGSTSKWVQFKKWIRTLVRDNVK